MNLSKQAQPPQKGFGNKCLHPQWYKERYVIKTGPFAYPLGTLTPQMWTSGGFKTLLQIH